MLCANALRRPPKSGAIRRVGPSAEDGVRFFID
jgi:hypothetical protein